MKKIFFVSFIFFVINVQSQTEKKTVVVDASGWKKVARLDGASGRGYHEIVLMTQGGASEPRVAKISWFKGWSTYGGLNLVSLSNNGFWADARITYDGTKAFLEINFTSAIPTLIVYMDQSAWSGGDILDGTLPNGGGTVIVSAKFGRVNYGENDLYLAYNGNLGLGISNPSAKLDVNGNIKGKDFITVDKNGSYRIALNGQTDGYIYGRNDNSENKFLIHSNGNSWFNGGNVGIGTTSPDAKLTVKGKIHAEEVKVDLSVPGPDYVLKEGYGLKSLKELQSYIKEHGHLPNIPSAKEMEQNGIQLGEMNMKLLEKIEELTLYIIELKKELNQLKKEQ